MSDEARSQEACPACGQHRLALLRFPGEAPDDDEVPQAVMGATLGRSGETPAIGCLACGAEWRDLASLREAQQGRS